MHAHVNSRFCLHFTKRWIGSMDFRWLKCVANFKIKRSKWRAKLKTRIKLSLNWVLYTKYSDRTKKNLVSSHTIYTACTHTIACTGHVIKASLHELQWNKCQTASVYMHFYTHTCTLADRLDASISLATTNEHFHVERFRIAAPPT